MKLIYIATPYSNPDPQVRQRRFEEACLAAKVLSTNYIVYSPIAHWHAIALDHKLPTDAQFWKEQNEGFMQRCDMIVVVMFDGWKESKGVKMEIDFATHNMKELIYIDPSTFEVVTSGD